MEEGVSVHHVVQHVLLCRIKLLPLLLTIDDLANDSPGTITLNYSWRKVLWDSSSALRD